ncbi:hypothetical protein HK105_208434 [Polyrhizophydium stewartii]|uniref:Ankyrin repeat domain containing protein n=1 Tax=Polyrhizophydium stewartii TaxID=2732419 RepID=A0ABR4MXS3_9FUNG
MIPLPAAPSPAQHLARHFANNRPMPPRPKKHRTASPGPPAADAPLPRGASHWDRLPLELRDMVAAAAAPALARFLRRPPLVAAEVASLRSAEVCRLWTEALDSDWQGDLGRLPAIDGDSPVLLAVRSRRTLDRIVGRGVRVAAETVMRLAVRHGWTDLMDAEHCEVVAEAAASEGAVHVLADLVDERKAVSVTPWHAECAAEDGQLGAVEWLLARTDAPPWITDAAARSGSVDLVAWLHARGVGAWTPRTMDSAARRGRLRVVEWLADHRREGCSVDAFRWAFDNGHADVLEFLCVRFPAVLERARTTAGYMFNSARHLGSLLWAKKHLPDMHVAADLSRFFDNYGAGAVAMLADTKDPTTLSDVLRWAIVHNCADAVSQLIKREQVQVEEQMVDPYWACRSTDALAVVIKHDGRWAAMLANRAAQLHGNADLLEWLHVRFPGSVSQSVLEAAVRAGSKAATELLVGKIKDVEWDLDGVLALAKQQRNAQIEKILRSAKAERKRRSSQSEKTQRSTVSNTARGRRGRK